MQVTSVSFTGNVNTKRDIEEKRKKVGEAAVGGGAVAAASSKAGFRMFNSTKKLGYMSQEVMDNIKLARKPVVETKSLFSRFGKMAKEFTEAVTGWAQKTPILNKVVKSKAFIGAASCFGFGLAVLTLITGLTNIATTTTAAYNEHISKSKFLNSLADES